MSLAVLVGPQNGRLVSSPLGPSVRPSPEQSGQGPVQDDCLHASTVHADPPGWPHPTHSGTSVRTPKQTVKRLFSLPFEVQLQDRTARAHFEEPMSTVVRSVSDLTLYGRRYRSIDKGRFECSCALDEKPRRFLFLAQATPGNPADTIVPRDAL